MQEGFWAMKLKNITDSIREIRDIDGRLLSVNPGKTVKVRNTSYNNNVFELCLEKKEKKEEINSEKEVE